MVNLLLVLAAIYSAYRSMRSQRLLIVTLWLALTSALVSVLLFQLGAPEVAVIELSVGAGLVTVLFVFAFSIVGEDTFDELTIVPRPLVWALVLLVSFLLGWFVLPQSGEMRTAVELPLTRLLWEQRGLDVLAQIILIFAGVMGLLGLLNEKPSHKEALAALQGEGQASGPSSTESVSNLVMESAAQAEAQPPEKVLA
jgi:uncharacterized MnhB-related membrane protein